MAGRRWGLAHLVKVLLIAAVVSVGYIACLNGAVKARITGNEASAIGALRSIVSGQLTYSATACAGRYAPTLTSLGAKGYISPDLSVADTVDKAGYRVTMTVPSHATAGASDQSPACKDSVTAFIATAVPLEPGRTGSRFFITDDTGDLKQATSASFTDATLVQ